MAQSLIELVLLSERRKDLLLLLKEGPKDIDEIKEALSVNSASIQPHIKKVKNSFLVTENNRSYKLSHIGEIIVGNMQELLETLEVLDRHIDYWTTHELAPIPEHLLKRIEELGSCELMEPEPEHMFETPTVFQDNVLKSKEILTFVSYFHPEAPYLYSGLAEMGVDVTLCMTDSVAERLFESYPREAEKLSKQENSKLFICRKPVELPALVVTDRFMCFKLFENDGKLRDQMLLSLGKEALQWGRELFLHYLEMSEPLDEKELL